jgi:ATP-dependent helicase/nuclease subunit B
VWAGAQVHEREAQGWTTMVAEAGGEYLLANGITLKGRADRIDRDADGRLAIIDYKTGRAPNGAQVRAGFANQLGLLMAMTAAGVLHTRGGPVRGGSPEAIAYWRLSGGRVEGEIKDPLKGNPPLTAAAHADEVMARALRLTTLFLLGDAAFEAKLQPGLAWGDYDHLARVAEWLDRPERREIAR